MAAKMAPLLVTSQASSSAATDNIYGGGMNLRACPRVKFRNGYLVALLLCPGLNTVAKIWQQIVFAILAKENCQKCIEKIANIAKITNSTRIANCTKILLTNFCRNFKKNLFNRNCLQKSKKVCKNRKSNRKFHVNKKTPR